VLQSSGFFISTRILCPRGRREEKEVQKRTAEVDETNEVLHPRQRPPDHHHPRPEDVVFHPEDDVFLEYWLFAFSIFFWEVSRHPHLPA
jgi:hypothetical protein